MKVAVPVGCDKQILFHTGKSDGAGEDITQAAIGQSVIIEQCGE